MGDHWIPIGSGREQTSRAESDRSLKKNLHTLGGVLREGKETKRRVPQSMKLKDKHGSWASPFLDCHKIKKPVRAVVQRTEEKRPTRLSTGLGRGGSRVEDHGMANAKLAENQGKGRARGGESYWKGVV